MEKMGRRLLKLAAELFPELAIRHVAEAARAGRCYGSYPLAYDATSLFFHSPLLLGAGGRVLGDDGEPALFDPPGGATFGWPGAWKRAGILPPEPSYNDAVRLFEEGRARVARPYAERAIALAPAEPRVMDTLALALTELGDLDPAIELLRRAAIAESADPAVEAHLARALARRGDQDQARELLVRLLADPTALAKPDRADAEALLMELGGHQVVEGPVQVHKRDVQSQPGHPERRRGLTGARGRRTRARLTLRAGALRGLCEEPFVEGHPPVLPDRAR